MRFSAETIFRAIDHMTGPLSRMERRVGKFVHSAAAAARRADPAVNAMGQGLRNVATYGTGAALAIGAVGVNVIQTGAQFEKSLMGAAARFPGLIRRGTKEFNELRDAALRTGAVTEFTAQATAEALTSLAQAGFTAKQAIAVLPGVVDLATAAEVDLGTASNMAADSLAAYGMMTSNTSKLTKNLTDVMDTMSTVANASTVGLSDLYETIQAGAGAAKEAGIGLHTYLAMAGIIAPVAKGEKAGMQLKNMMLRLAAADGPGAKALASLGFSAKKMKNELKDPVAFLKKFKTALDKSGNRTGMIKEIIGREAFAGMALMLRNIPELERLIKEVDTATGSSKRMAAAMRDTMKGAMDILRSSIEGVSLKIFFLVNKDLEALIKKVNEWVVATGKVIGSNGDLVKGLGTDLFGVLKDVGLAILIFAGIFAALKTAIMLAQAANIAYQVVTWLLVAANTAATVATSAFAVAAWSLTAAFLANPVTWIVVGIIALIAAVVLAIVFWKQWTSAVINFFKAVGKVFSWLWGIGESLGSLIADLWFRFSSILQVLGLLNKKIKTEVQITETRKTADTPGGSAARDGGARPAGSAITSSAQTTTRSESFSNQNATLWVRKEKGVKADLAGANGRGPAPAPFKLAPSGSFE